MKNKKHEFLQEAYLKIGECDEEIRKLERQKLISSKIAKLINSGRDPEFFDDCKSFDDAVSKFKDKYGFLL